MAVIVKCLLNREGGISLQKSFTFLHAEVRMNGPKDLEKGVGPLDFLAEGPDGPPNNF